MHVLLTIAVIAIVVALVLRNARPPKSLLNNLRKLGDEWHGTILTSYAGIRKLLPFLYAPDVALRLTRGDIAFVCTYWKVMMSSYNTTDLFRIEATAPFPMQPLKLIRKDPFFEIHGDHTPVTVDGEHYVPTNEERRNATEYVIGKDTFYLCAGQTDRLQQTLKQRETAAALRAILARFGMMEVNGQVITLAKYWSKHDTDSDALKTMLAAIVAFAGQLKL